MNESFGMKYSGLSVPLKVQACKEFNVYITTFWLQINEFLVWKIVVPGTLGWYLTGERCQALPNPLASQKCLAHHLALAVASR